VITSDDDVVKDTDVNECKCIAHAAGDQLIGMARLRDTGRVLGFIRECQQGS
jgi:hypothetical protein